MNEVRRCRQEKVAVGRRFKLPVISQEDTDIVNSHLKETFSWLTAPLQAKIERKLSELEEYWFVRPEELSQFTGEWIGAWISADGNYQCWLNYNHYSLDHGDRTYALGVEAKVIIPEDVWEAYITKGENV